MDNKNINATLSTRSTCEAITHQIETDNCGADKRPSRIFVPMAALMSGSAKLITAFTRVTVSTIIPVSQAKKYADGVHNH